MRNIAKIVFHGWIPIVACQGNALYLDFEGHEVVIEELGEVGFGGGKVESFERRDVDDIGCVA
jgi:hypothetical protein